MSEIAPLVAMGFTEEQATVALQASAGDVGDAINLLLLQPTALARRPAPAPPAAGQKRKAWILDRQADEEIATPTTAEQKILDRLGLECITTLADGNCLPDALFQAFCARDDAPPSTASALYRNPQMYARAFGPNAAVPASTVALSYAEMRAVIAANFTSEQYQVACAAKEAGMTEGTWHVRNSLEETRQAMKSKYYWLDEAGISLLEQYLSLRILVVKTTERAARRFHTSGNVTLPMSNHGARFVVVRLVRQHYTLLQATDATAVFSPAPLPSKVKAAFRAQCSQLS